MGKLNRKAADWEAFGQLYEEGLQLPVEERNRWLDALAVEQPDVSADLRQLFAKSALSTFLEKPACLQLFQSAPPKDLAPGAELGDFRIGRILGRGAFATVYLATEVSLSREIALKVSGQPFDEGRTLARLEHDHIVRVYRAGAFDNGTHYVAMQWVPGPTLDGLLENLRRVGPVRLGQELLERLESLGTGNGLMNSTQHRIRDWVTRTPFSEVILWWGDRLAEALATAHGSGVLHLDIKPSNILVHPCGAPMLTDFNISQRPQDELQNPFGGTLHYMSPEQHKAFEATSLEATRQARADLDGRSDLYSLGEVLREIAVLCPDFPRRFHFPIDRAREADRNERYREAREMSSALETQRHLGQSMRKAPKPGGFLNLALKRPLLSLVLLGAIPQILAGAVGSLYNELRIVGALSESHRELFRLTHWVYSPSLFALTGALWVALVLRFRSILERPEAFRGRVEETQKLRRLALNLPRWGWAMTCAGWIPGMVIFPAVLHFGAGGLSPSVVSHFAASFSLSFLIALSYSYLIHQLIVVRSLYPRLWISEGGFATQAPQDLGHISKEVVLFCLLTSGIPLLAASLMIAVAPEGFVGHGYLAFRTLLTSLIGLGAAGVGFAIFVAQHLVRFLRHLRGSDDY